MGKYDGYLLCTDFDGTFALPGTKLSEENLAAIRRFQAEGGLFTIASGRQPQFLRELVGPFEANAPIIAMNGTMICDEHSFAVIKDYPVGEEILPVLDEIADLDLCDNLILWNERWGKRFTGSRSWPTGFEIQGKEGGKGAALQWIRRYLGERVRITVGVGDFENDISLIRDADIGYAVANAIPEAKAAADRVTVAHTEHAIAAIIEELA